MTDQDSITCPQCDMTSYHPKDVEHRYCGNCHQYHDHWKRSEILKAIEAGTRDEKIARAQRAGILDEEGNLSEKYQPAGEEDMTGDRYTKGPLKLKQASAREYLDDLKSTKTKYFRTEYPVLLHWILNWYILSALRKGGFEVEAKRSPTYTFLRRGYKYKVTGSGESFFNWRTFFESKEVSHDR